MTCLNCKKLEQQIRDLEYQLSFHNKPTNQLVQEIFDHWNSVKVCRKWKAHRKLTYDITRAVVVHFEHWSISDIKDAISNFAKIVQYNDYKWTYDKWGLATFMSRREPEDKGAYRWWRFLPNNFREKDELTKDAIQLRAKVRESYSENIKTASKELLLDRYIKGTYNWLIDELRPEIKDLYEQAVKEKSKSKLEVLEKES